MTDKERKDKVGETNFKISMDISPEEFAKKQAASKDKLTSGEEADEERAEQEIAEQDANE